MPSPNILVHIADRVLNRPLMILPEKLALIASILDGRIGIDAAGLKPEWKATAAARVAGMQKRNDQAPYFRTRAGVAIIPVVGSLVNRGSFIDVESGLSSYRTLTDQAAHAAADPETKAILLDIDSPGGEAVGNVEAADAIRALAARKPVTAVVNGMAASAAYAIASAATRIVTIPTGVVGSIGVVMLHADYSGALGKAGVVPTLIFAGAHKVDGNPYEKLGPGVRDDWQGEVDKYYGMFVATVAKGRGTLSEADIRGTEARVYIGQDAVKTGLADAVGTFESALADLEGTRRRPGSSIAAAVASGPWSQAAQERAAAILALPRAPGLEALAQTTVDTPCITVDQARVIFDLASAQLRANRNTALMNQVGRSRNAKLGLVTDKDLPFERTSPIGVTVGDGRPDSSGVWDEAIAEVDAKLKKH